jgi:hypothetical protein
MDIELIISHQGKFPVIGASGNGHLVRRHSGLNDLIVVIAAVRGPGWGKFPSVGFIEKGNQHVWFGRKLHPSGHVDGQFQIVTPGTYVIVTFRCNIRIPGVAGTLAGSPAGARIVTNLGARRLLIAFTFTPSGLARYAIRLFDTGNMITGLTPDTAHIPDTAGVIEADPADFGHDT